jgi:hypothetical protein
VPARDEEARLPRLLAALARQTVHRRLGAPLDVVIVVNNTTDGSVAVAEAVAAVHPQLRLAVAEVAYPQEWAQVGTARRHAMELAAEAAPNGTILTTDADAVPAKDWIARTLDALHAGADLVGGRIVGDPDEEARLGRGFARRAGLHARYAALRDELGAMIDPLEHDPWPRHQDHTGASLAVRTDVYRRLGGIVPLPFREDLGFVSKARASGHRLVHPLDVVVTVSARTEGRAPGGMAECVRSWVREEAAMAPVLVECPSRVEDRLRLRRALRDRAHDERAAHALLLARGFRLPEKSIRPVLSLIECFAADDPDAPSTTPARVAIARIERRISHMRERSYAA